MEKCFDYYDCSKSDCIMFKKDKAIFNCWEIDGTLCNHSHLYQLEKLKLNKCKFCLYYKSVNPS